MKTKYFLTALLLAASAAALQARPHHNEGVHLAAEIVGLVKTAITPAPQTVVVAPAPAPAPVVVAPAPAPAPVVVTPAPVVIPEYGYGWWQGTWVPCYNNWYWHHGTWVWGGRGPRPVPPRWAPDFNRRPMPPPPRVHHRPAPVPHRVTPPPHHRPAPPPGVAPRPHHHGGRPAAPPHRGGYR